MDRSAETKATAISDEQIVELYWQRDQQAINETDVKYGKMLFRIAYNILHDRLDSDECKNDTYLGIWDTIPPTRPVVFPAFITQIMRYIAIKRYKQKTSQKRIPSEMTVSLDEIGDILNGDDTPDSELTAIELGRLISAFIRTLSDRQQYIFIGRYYMAETIEYLAEHLHVGVATVHRDIEKIKAGLKNYFERNGVSI